jgi:hypothetical protein
VALLPERETASGFSILGGIMESTSKKARKLLSKWRPLLVNHAIDYRRWSFKEGMTAIVFLGESDGEQLIVYSNAGPVLIKSTERRCVDTAWEVVTGTVKLPDVLWWWENETKGI